MTVRIDGRPRRRKGSAGRVRIEGFDFVDSDRTLFVTSANRRIRCPDGYGGAEALLQDLLRQFDILVFERLEGQWYNNASYDLYLHLVGVLAGGFLNKAAFARKRVLLASDRFPSSQLCSGCHAHNNVPLEAKAWICRACGGRHERDQNAARNLKALGQQFQAGRREYIQESYPCWSRLGRT